MLKEHGELTKDYRLGLAKEAFAHTAAYDVAIANYMSSILNEGPTPPEYLSAYEKVTDLRYGKIRIKRRHSTKKSAKLMAWGP